MPNSILIYWLYIFIAYIKVSYSFSFFCKYIYVISIQKMINFYWWLCKFVAAHARALPNCFVEGHHCCNKYQWYEWVLEDLSLDFYHWYFSSHCQFYPPVFLDNQNDVNDCIGYFIHFKTRCYSSLRDRTISHFLVNLCQCYIFSLCFSFFEYVLVFCSSCSIAESVQLFWK